MCDCYVKIEEIHLSRVEPRPDCVPPEIRPDLLHTVLNV